MIRADYIHEDRYASLGLAVLHRQPLAFLPRDERSAVCEVELARHLPDAVPLNEVLSFLVDR